MGNLGAQLTQVGRYWLGLCFRSGLLCATSKEIGQNTVEHGGSLRGRVLSGRVTSAMLQLIAFTTWTASAQRLAANSPRPHRRIITGLVIPANRCLY